MRPVSFYVACLGCAMFVVAACLFWKPIPVSHHPSAVVDQTKRGVFFAITKTSTSLIAVGEHGRIFFSTNQGQTWRSVSTNVDQTLTGIFMLNDLVGWVVGYDGIILKTNDGGVTWSVLRKPTLDEPPFFAVWFQDEAIGVVVGADSRTYRTNDGGLSWDQINIDAQAHLYAITHSADNALWIIGENSTLYQSVNAGMTWARISTPFPSSFFGLISLPDNTVMTYGLRGRVALWNNSKLIQTKQVIDESLFAGVVLKDQRVALVGKRGHIFIGDVTSLDFKSKEIMPNHDISGIVEVDDAFILTGDFGIAQVAKKDVGL